MNVNDTIVELARLALYAYTVLEARRIITHWIDSGPAVFPRRTAEEKVIDVARRSGVDVSNFTNAQVFVKETA